MGLKRRVVRLEKDAGVGLCRCPLRQVIVVHPGEPDPPPPPRRPDGACPTCGGRKPDLFPHIIIHLPPEGRDAPYGEGRWD